MIIDYFQETNKVKLSSFQDLKLLKKPPLLFLHKNLIIRLARNLNFGSLKNFIIFFLFENLQNQNIRSKIDPNPKSLAMAP